MTQQDTTSLRWQERASLLFAWLLLFFPIGLYGLWSSTLFAQNRKWQITGAVVLVLVVTSAGLFNLLYALLLVPLAIWLLWRDRDLSRTTFRYFAVGGGVAALLALGSAGSGGGGFGAGSCTEVQSQGGWTYYRDADCNVIGRMRE